jgi:RNA polymerase sigma-B factor
MTAIQPALLRVCALETQSQRCADDSRARVERVLFASRDAGDPGARDALVERFLPLARSLARRYERSGEPMDDLVQVASLALVNAIDRFDATHGYAFSSFAVPTIIGALKRHFRDRTWIVRPPRKVQELTLRVEHATRRLSQDFDRAPTMTELATAVDSDEEQVLAALLARGSRHALSLQSPGIDQGEDSPLQDTLGCFDEGYALAESRVMLAGLLPGLTPRLREVLRLRFELDLTQAQIGQQLGVGQIQISRLIHQALAQLRHVADQQQRLTDGELEPEYALTCGS